MSIFILLVVTFGFLHFAICINLRVIPEKIIIHMVNASYAENVKFFIRRYGRRGEYYVHGEGTIKQTFGDNISARLDIYEFLHNEYKPTFIQFKIARGCEFLNNDKYMGKSLNEGLKRSGISCPSGPGHYAVRNMTMHLDYFPYLWPFQKGKAVLTVMCNNNFVGNGTTFIRFEQKKH